MKLIKIIIFILLLLCSAYVTYLYTTSTRVTYLIPLGYEGPLLIVANQKDGIEINRDHAVFDFTKNNVIKIKGELVTGFFPWGYLNYYVVDESGNKEKLESTNYASDKIEAEDKVYVWSNLHIVGSCEAKYNGKTTYESTIVSKRLNIDKILGSAHGLINQEVCSR